MDQQRAAARAELEAQRAVRGVGEMMGIDDRKNITTQPSQGRVLPTTHDQTVDYLLQTDASEMEYEVARCKPMLTADFMQHLERCISTCT